MDGREPRRVVPLSLQPVRHRDRRRRLLRQGDGDKRSLRRAHHHRLCVRARSLDRARARGWRGRGRRTGERHRVEGREAGVIDLAFSLGLAVSTLAVAVAYAERVARVGAARDARIERAGSSVLLGKGAMEKGYWEMRPAARACIAVGLTANAVSMASFAFAALAGVSLALGAFGVGAVLSLVSSACDALDGMVARETGTASDS